MKTTKILLILLTLATLISSCQKESLVNNLDLQDKKEHLIFPKVVTIANNKAFQFKNKEALYTFIKYLEQKNTVEKNKITRTLGVTSLLDKIVSLESYLENLGRSFSEEKKDLLFKEVKEIQEKSSKYALYSQDLSDFSPYPAIKDISLEAIANLDFQYMIGDSVVTLEKYDSLEEFENNVQFIDISFNESQLPFKANTAFAVTNNRKAKGQLSKNDRNEIHMRLSCQKWTIAWWARYKTTIRGEFSVSVTGMDFLLNSEKHVFQLKPKFTNDDPKKNPFTLYTTSSQKYDFSLYSEEFNGVETFRVGQFENEDGSHHGNGKMNGHFSIWSRGVPESKKATDTIDL